MNLLKNKNKFSGGALILQMFLAVCFMVWLFPVNAFAAVEVDWDTITSTVEENASHNGASDTSGDGWSYSHDTDTVTIAEGTKVTGNVDKFICPSGPGNIENIHSNGGIFNGTIVSGNFTGTLINEGRIEGGTFKGTVTNEFGGKINSGTFTNAVTNNGRIYGGTFTNTVTNDSYIHNGTFEGTVTNMSFIVGGTFTGAVTSENSSHITDGTFTDTVTNEGIISKGTFNIIVNKVNGHVGSAPDVTYNKLINEGNGSNPNPNPGDDEGNTPPQNPGNSESNTSNSKDNADNDNEYVFVEPVVIVVSEGQKYVDDVMEQLATVPTNGKVVIDTKDWYCFNRILAEKVTSMKDITVTIKYKYQGKKYEVTIPAGSDIVSLLGETGFVGFRYLDLVFGGREITE